MQRDPDLGYYIIPGDEPMSCNLIGILELSSWEGAISAGSQETIRMAVRPSVRAQHCCRVTYTLLPAPRGELHSGMNA